ncbi:MAG: single-stranded DNA-binding protein [Kiritimatiellales bacterium]|nr:single-stranded DNA-binding protein [Kiritimatiellales bacterium]
MKSVNKVTLLGNVTRDPELKSTTNGQSVCTFGLATNRVWRDGGGDKQSLPEYHNLVAWGGLAEFCSENIKKGKPLYIEGYLKTRSWDSPEGTKIFRTEIVLENIVLLGPRDDAAIRSVDEVPEADTAVAADMSEMPLEEVA